MIKLKRGEKLYKVAKEFYWSPWERHTKPGEMLGLNEGGAAARVERKEVVEVTEGLDKLCEAYEKHNPDGVKAHAEKAKALADSKKKGLDALKKRDPEGFKAREAALAKAKKEAKKDK